MIEKKTGRSASISHDVKGRHPGTVFLAALVASGIGTGLSSPAAAFVCQGEGGGVTGSGAAGNSVACGDGVNATQANTVAVGENSTATGVGAVAVGNMSLAFGTSSVALGQGSRALEANTVSVGVAGAERRVVNVASGTLATGSTDAATGGQLFTTNQNVTNLGGQLSTTNQNVANLGGQLSTTNQNVANLGGQLSTTNQNVTNIQNGQTGPFRANNTSGLAAGQATGADAITGGFGTVASGAQATAIGTGAQATMAGATAIGAGAVASGDPTTAVGFNAAATGDNASAFGATATASGTSALALGFGSTAAQANSVAIGAGATTTRANQIVIGTAARTYTLPGLTSAASLAAQTGPTSLVTTDSSGNLAATNLNVGNLANLDGRVSSLETSVGQLRRDVRTAYQGTAIALAVGGAVLPAGKKYAISANFGTFEGETAFGASGDRSPTTSTPPAEWASESAGGPVWAAAAASHTPGDDRPPKRRRPMKGGVAAMAYVCGAVFAFSAILAQAQTKVATDPPKPAQIDRNGTLILIRSTLLALNSANETGNYTVLRDLAAPGFRDANTAARLGEIFASQRQQRLDLSGVAALDPQLTLLPQIEANGMLRMAGFFPSVPQQVNFELLFTPVEGRWRVFGLSVNVGSATPVPPAPPVTASPASESTRQREPAKASRASPQARPGMSPPEPNSSNAPPASP